MSVFLVPATRKNLEKSIEKSVDIDFVKEYLSPDFINELLSYSGIEGIRCWALTKNSIAIFNQIKNGDEVLLTEKGTGRFTHYGIVIGKTQNEMFGNALWPIFGNNPWEFIYFLANITRINIDKSELVTRLGYASNYTVSGAIKVNEERYQNIGNPYHFLEIPIYPNVAEVNESQDFYGEDIISLSKRRLGHNKFSKSVKKNYKYVCAVCGINEPEFLIAGHISPWSEDAENRLNPRNGICLCVFHDRAFEHGYIGLSDDLRVVVNPNIKYNSPLYKSLKQYEDKLIRMPIADKPGQIFVTKHRKKHKLE